MQSVIEVDAQGEIMEYYTMSDDEIKEAQEGGRNIITDPWQEPLFSPKYDFESKSWVEGLGPEELQLRRKELEGFNNKVTDDEMNAIATMELSQIVYGGM